MTIRVFIEYAPNLIWMLGIWPVEQCTPTISLAKDGDQHTFDRIRSTDRWMLYRHNQ